MANRFYGGGPYIAKLNTAGTACIYNAKGQMVLKSHNITGIETMTIDEMQYICEGINALNIVGISEPEKKAVDRQDVFVLGSN